LNRINPYLSEEKKMKQPANPDNSAPGWKSLYRVGGAAAFLAGALFRRNIAAEIGLFSREPSPASVGEWFALLQSSRILGLTYLNVFDLVNYLLVGLMFLALFVVLKRTSQSLMAAVLMLSFLGIAVFFASNTAFSMLSLSHQYSAVVGEAERSALLAAGQALLALNRFSDAASSPGTGGLISLLLVALAGLLASLVMLRSTIFSRAAGFVGLLASSLDLAYCAGYIFLPSVEGSLLAVLFIPAAGLLLMVWHIMVGWRLYRLGRRPVEEPGGLGERILTH
jgi:hypothetical protein